MFFMSRFGQSTTKIGHFAIFQIIFTINGKSKVVATTAWNRGLEEELFKPRPNKVMENSESKELIG